MPKVIGYISEQPRKIPVWYDVDVLVCGAGPSGIAAAVCAGRTGLNVVVAEMTAHPGGQTNNVTWITDFENKGGIVRELYSHLIDIDAYQFPYYNPFILIPYYDELFRTSNVRPLYFATAVAPIVTDNKLSGVIFETKSGRGAVKAKIVIDATGDGDIAARAGACFSMGREKDGATQAMSMTSLLLNWNDLRLDKDAMRDLAIEAGKKAGTNYALPYEKWSPKPVINMPSVSFQSIPHATGYDPTDVESLSDALIELRRQTVEMVEILSTHTEEFASVKLGPFNAIPGIRESRRIVTDKIITKEDAVNGARFSDGLFIITQNIDIHKCVEGEPGYDIIHVKPYHFPYGAMLPKGLENILVVGKCIGGDHETLASYRIFSDCMSMGEAAARAAKMAIDKKCSLREIDIDNLKAYMAKQGYVQ